MTKRMLIDATHAEETRVVVLDGNRLEDFDVETSTKRQLKGNIYLAKVVRVEPSLQAAFVEYGGNRHGFLAFGEIHPDYYQIPVADRQRLIAMEEEEARREEEEADREMAQEEPPARHRAPRHPADRAVAPHEPATDSQEAVDEPGEVSADAADASVSVSETFAVVADAPAEGEAFSGSADLFAGAPAEPAQAAGSDAAAETEASAEPPAAATAGTATETPVDAATDPVDGVAAPVAAEAAAPVAVASVSPAAEPAAPVAGEVPPEPAGSAPAEAVAAPPAAAAIPPAAGGEAAAAAPADPVDPPPAASHPSDAPGPEDEPPAHRAQPMAIETEIVRGPLHEAGDQAADDATAGPVPGYPAHAATSDADRDTPYERAPQPYEASSQPDAYRTVPDEDDSDTLEADEADTVPEGPPPETVGGDEQDNGDEQRERRPPPRFLRNYKIQEVIRRRQILLVQVVKEERGTKGAALTTYLSLAGRFSVLMPNSPRGGGISRKITSAADRRRLKEVMAELDIPKGMGLIVRTAGANRPKPEIKRDCEYLLRLWDDIREHTMKSIAPALIYEEASLIKRAIRDVYSRDIDEIWVDGEDGWRAAHDFMRMLMPSHAKKVQLWRDPSQPLFSRYAVEQQLEAMLAPTAQLRSGGYLVINQAEALVAIDVNSGRSTRERGIEETALRTNLEAADEVARQLRLRDLAGLIVIDFIDMESRKHNAMVERRLKDALKNDRARIQVGTISHFGLMEMSRQRLRPSLAETSFIACPHCGGMGHVRSTESAAIHVLRGIEEEGGKRRAAEIVVYVSTQIALYILNHKRERLVEIEHRYDMRVTITGDDAQIIPLYRIERLRPQVPRDEAAPVAMIASAPSAAQPGAQPRLPPPEPTSAEPEPAEAASPGFGVEDEEEPAVVEAEDEAEDEDTAESAEEARAEGSETAAERAGRRRRRRRRRGGRREDAGAAAPAAAPQDEHAGPAVVGEFPDAEPPIAASETDADEVLPEMHMEGVPEAVEPAAAEDAGGRRRGRRGGRRRRREPGEAEASPFAAPEADQPDLAPVYAGPTPVYTGPTPANPFGGHAFDIFDVLEQAEANAAARSLAAMPAEPAPPAPEPAPAAPVSYGFDAVESPAASAPAPEHAMESAGPVEVPEGGSPTAEAPSPVAPADASLSPAEPLSVVSEPATAAATASPEADLSSAAEATRAATAATATAAEPTASAPVAVADMAAGAAPGVAANEEAAGVTTPPANDVAPEPLVKPIIIGSGDEPPAAKKRGWWRR